MQDAGTALMGIGSARGAERAVKATEAAIASPLLDTTIDGAHGVLLSIQGGSNLGIHEINEAASLITEVVHPDANVIFGMSIDDTLGDEVRVTVIAAGFDGREPSAPRDPLPTFSSYDDEFAPRGVDTESIPTFSAPGAFATGDVPSIPSQFDDADDRFDLPEFLK
jgi:cell division protein FtsZ